MIGFETAKALKEAGLQWKPQLNDIFFNISKVKLQFDYPVQKALLFCSDETLEKLVFAPRLDQMLKDIEGQGFRYILEPTGKKDEVQYCLTLLEWDDNVAEISFGNGWHLSANFCATSPEEATAQALLWILREEVCSCESQ